VYFPIHYSILIGTHLMVIVWTDPPSHSRYDIKVSSCNVLDEWSLCEYSYKWLSWIEYDILQTVNETRDKSDTTIIICILDIIILFIIIKTIPNENHNISILRYHNWPNNCWRSHASPSLRRRGFNNECQYEIKFGYCFV